MGSIKKALMEAECNGHVHPVLQPFLTQALSAMQPAPACPQETATIYGLYANGILLTTYLHKATAEYECWVSRVGEEISHAETLTDYEVRPLTMHTHQQD